MREFNENMITGLMLLDPYLVRVPVLAFIHSCHVTCYDAQVVLVVNQQETMISREALLVSWGL